MNHADVIVVGAGAAGMLSASTAAAAGKHVHVFEKANKSGVKILMSGGTRCNLTHDCDPAGIMEAFGKNGRFLRQALSDLSPNDVVQMFHRLGVPTKVESTGKVFPVSDRALDVCRALEREMLANGTQLHLGDPVREVSAADEGFEVCSDQTHMHCKALIVTVGGMSYPGCGTTGDGYAWLKSMGHTIVSPRPALVPLLTDAGWLHELSGITLPQSAVSVVDPAKPKKKSLLTRRAGSVLLTHFGLSGPAPMDVSRFVTAQATTEGLFARIHTQPDWDSEKLMHEMEQQRAHQGTKQVQSVAAEFVPKRLSLAVLERLSIDPAKRLAEVPKRELRRLVDDLLFIDVPISGTRGFKKAEVTAGGVSLKEVDPRTMESRIVPGLYIAGEILDLDGWIGGYNFQSAFSTGFVAGRSAAQQIQ